MHSEEGVKEGFRRYGPTLKNEQEKCPQCGHKDHKATGALTAIGYCDTCGCGMDTKGPKGDK
jgi:ribosomal protein L37AE/L43A